MERQNGNTTLEDILEAVHLLSEQTDSRFEAIDSRFEAIDSRFEAIDRQFGDLRSHMDQQFEKIDTRLAALHGELEQLRIWLERLERRTFEDAGVAAKDILTLRKEFSVFDARLRALELKLGQA